MKKNQRRLATLRNKIVKLLETFGIQRSDEDLQEDLFLERDMKRVNTGEAYYYLEGRLCDISWLWSDILYDRTTLEKSREKFYMQLRCGIEFSYVRNRRRKFEIINLINWDKPEANNFCYQLKVPAYRELSKMENVPTDDFIWDLIISVNHLPMVAVVIEPNIFEQASPCSTAYKSMRQELQRDPFMATYLQMCIVCDGKTALVGTTTDDYEDFREWPSLMGEVTEKTDIMTPFMSLLRPDRMLDVIRNFVRVVVDEDREHNIMYMADWKKYFAVTQVASAVKKHFAETQSAIVGHVLLEKDTMWRDFGMGDDISVTMQFLWDYLVMENMIPDDTIIGCVTEKMPTDRPAVERENKDAPVILLCNSDVKTSDIQQYHERFPDVSLIQFQILPLMTYPQQFAGELIYRQNSRRGE